MIRILPRYDPEDLFMRLFHKAVGSQWSAADVDWEAPLGLAPRQAAALTRILSPVYLGEQSAMYGAAGVLPQLAQAGETSAQLYLSTFLLDEARHFDALTHFYNRLGHHPVQLREVPEMLRYHHRLRQGDRIDWLWGILISDLFARQFYQAFAKIQPGALFGRMSARVLIDESRHQAFAHTYLKNAVPLLSPERRAALRSMQSDLLGTMAAMHRRLRDDAAVLGFDGEAFLGELTAQIEAHSRNIGLAGGDGRDGPNGGGNGGSGGGHMAWAEFIERKRALAGSLGGVDWPEENAGVAATAIAPGPAGTLAARVKELAQGCGGCLLAAICSSRAVAPAG